MKKIYDNYQDTNFNYKNIISTKNVKQTQDDNGNLYYTTFDSSDLHIPGQKIWKYNISTRDNEIYWENKEFKVGSFHMIIDIKGNIYLSSAGGVIILNNKNQFKTMPLVSGMVTDIIYLKNNIYVTTFDGLYKYNINTEITEKINLPNNLIVNSIFIDKNENIYLAIYKSINKPISYSVLIIKKGQSEAKPIIGDDFFNINDTMLITEINSKIYFYSLNLASKKAKLYYSDLDSNKVNYVLDLSINVQTLFNLNNELGLVTHEIGNTVIEVLNIDSIEKKYEIKNSVYEQIMQIQKFNILSLLNENKIDYLSW
ncbi:hypothetical protein [Spiroplasma endosymbiont of Amphimallon solstitiale]|uniref:hypothetical protein n=1 Tax=Spiroplasma endosymbiont of Amphimallon solstitiale TaxID=3066288 RepID=UPI00313D172B